MRAATIVLGIAAAIALPELAIAQAPATYIVDRANGPGTQFTEIVAAIAAVPSGSVLLVRQGNYQAVDINAKGMTILCDANVVSGNTSSPQNFLRIRNTLPNQVVIVRRLRSGTYVGAEVVNCQGPVTVSDSGYVASQYGWTPALLVQDSRQVALQGFTMQTPIDGPACEVIRSSLVIERCDVWGADAIYLQPSMRPAYPALRLDNSDVQLVHSTANGGDGYQGAPTVPGASAMQFLNATSRLRVVGLAAHALTGGVTSGLGSVAPLAGPGTARVDPLVPLVGAQPAGPGVTLVLTSMPSLVSTAGPVGGSLRVDRFGTPGAVYAIVLGVFGPPVVVPSLLDPVWLDLALLDVEAVGVAPATGAVTVTKAIPNVAALRGVALVWQAADLAPVLQVTNPTPTVVF